MRRAVQTYGAQWQRIVGDITPPQAAVLAVVHEHPGIDQTRLARASGIDTATLAPLIVRLEQRGLITRYEDTGNRRRKLVALTERGGHHLDEIAKLLPVVDADVLAALTQDQRANLRQALLLIGDAASALTEE